MNAKVCVDENIVLMLTGDLTQLLTPVIHLLTQCDLPQAPPAWEHQQPVLISQ